jgi:hypothetical protein
MTIKSRIERSVELDRLIPIWVTFPSEEDYSSVHSGVLR